MGVRLVDGTSLAAAVVIDNIPKGTNQVILAGKISKVARSVVAALCKKNVKVRTSYPHLLKFKFNHTQKWIFVLKCNKPIVLGRS